MTLKHCVAPCSTRRRLGIKEIALRAEYVVDGYGRRGLKQHVLESPSLVLVSAAFRGLKIAIWLCLMDLIRMVTINIRLCYSVFTNAFTKSFQLSRGDMHILVELITP